MVAARANEPERLSGELQIITRCVLEQGPEVNDVLRPCPVIPRQGFQGYQVPAASNWQSHAREHLERICRRHDFRLDPGRGEKKVDDDSRRRLAGRDEPYGRQSRRSFLLHGRFSYIALILELVDERFRFAIARSASLVNLGSVCIDTPNAPTTANSTFAVFRSNWIRRRISSRMVTKPWRPSPWVCPNSHRVRRRAGREATF